jgi:DNA-binding transcriptional ArsR family regulator
MTDRDRLVIRVLGALADPSRFEMLKQLCSGEKCVSELGQASSVSQSCATRHLQSLERAGLVSSRRAGKRVSYQLSIPEPAVRDLVAWAVRGSSSGGAFGQAAEMTGAAGPGGREGEGGRAAERGPSRDRGALTSPEAAYGAHGAHDPGPRVELRPGDIEDYLL